jgi:hypothetical protein
MLTVIGLRFLTTIQIWYTLFSLDNVTFIPGTVPIQKLGKPDYQVMALNPFSESLDQIFSTSPTTQNGQVIGSLPDFLITVTVRLVD